MLITLQSSSDADAAEFSNFFRETVQIEPNSEIALVNASYKFENGITVFAGVNDTFEVALASETLGTATVVAGEYTSPALFAAACTAALHTLIGTLPYETKQLFPLSSQKFTMSGTADTIKITLQYDPQEWNNALVLGPTAGAKRQQAFSTVAGVIPVNSKGIIKRVSGGATDGYNVDNWNSGTSLLDTNVMWASGRDTTQPQSHGKISLKGYKTDTVRWMVGVCGGDLPDSPADWANGSQKLGLAVQCMGDGTLRIHERNNVGSLATVKDGVVINDGEDIEIHFDAMTPASTDTYAKYFIGGTEEVIDAGADRWQLRPELDLVPVGSFFTLPTTSVLIDGGASYFLADCATLISNLSGGTGYCNGEIVSAEFTSGSTTTLLATTDANGVITGLSFQEHGGNLTGPSEGPVVLTGLMSGRTTATCTFSVPAQSASITTAGSNYNANPADLVFNAITYPNAISILTVGGGGELQDFVFSDLLRNAGIQATDVLEVHQGGHTDGRITINAVNASSVMIYDLITDVVERDMDEPLGIHNEANFRPSSGFEALTGLRGIGPIPATPLEEVGANPVNDDRETEVMLVNIDDFQIKSICKEGGIQKAVASLPYGATEPQFESGDPVKVDGAFYYEPYNLLYHRLENGGVENHNQLRVRITDAVGRPIQQLLHPTTITLDLRPRAK